MTAPRLDFCTKCKKEDMPFKRLAGRRFRPMCNNCFEESQPVKVPRDLSICYEEGCNNKKYKKYSRCQEHIPKSMNSRSIWKKVSDTDGQAYIDWMEKNTSEEGTYVTSSTLHPSNLMMPI